VEKIVSEVSSDRVADVMKQLGAFETRGNFTDPSQTNRGIGAARRWIYDQFKSYSPRLEVSFDSYKVKHEGRIFRDVELVNVVAVRPVPLRRKNASSSAAITIRSTSCPKPAPAISARTAMARRTPWT